MQLNAAEVLTDLASPPGNRLEILKGNRAGQHSIRINDQWRICFVWRDGGAEQVEIVEITIEDVMAGEKTMAGRTLPPVHPGEQLREEFMKPLGLSAYRLAKDLKVAVSRIQEIVAEKRAVSGDTALRLARYFRTSPEFWLNLQRDYDLEVARMTAGTEIAANVQPHADAAT